MLRKLIICLAGLSFILALTHILTPGQVKKAYNEDNQTECQKIWNQWFKTQHKAAKAELQNCLANASTKEDRKKCKEAYKKKFKELRKEYNENKKACSDCFKMANDNYKQARIQAKNDLNACLTTAVDKEARKACREKYKQDLKRAREIRKEERKECL